MLVDLSVCMCVRVVGVECVVGGGVDVHVAGVSVSALLFSLIPLISTLVLVCGCDVYGYVVGNGGVAAVVMCLYEFDVGIFIRVCSVGAGGDVGVGENGGVVVRVLTVSV